MDNHTVYYYEVNTEEEYNQFINHLIKKRPTIAWNSGRAVSDDYKIPKIKNIVLQIFQNRLGYCDLDSKFHNNKQYHLLSKQNKKISWDEGLIYSDGTTYLPYPFDNIYNF